MATRGTTTFSHSSIFPVSTIQYFRSCLHRSFHRPCDDITNFLRHLDEVRIGKMGVARRGPVPPMAEQLADQRKVLARHDRLTGYRVPKVM